MTNVEPKSHLLATHPHTWPVVGIWLFLIIIIVTLTAMHPEHRTVTAAYFDATENWWNARDFYNLQGRGFLYLPASIWIFTPFWALGKQIGTPLWILISTGTLGYAVWRFSGLVRPSNQVRFAALVLLIMIPGSAGAMRNGQATTLMLAFTMLAACYLVEGNYWKSALFLALAFALKPICIPFLLLAGVLFPAMGWRLAIAVIAVFSLPLLHAYMGYVFDQYARALESLEVSYGLSFGRWHDINGLLLKLGIRIHPAYIFALRVFAALATLAAGILVTKRCDRATGIIILLVLANSYVMLFNPRTESNTYIMLAVPLAFLTVNWSYSGQNRTLIAGLIVMAVALGGNGYGGLFIDLTQI